jgi:hypothetical protein
MSDDGWSEPRRNSSGALLQHRTNQDGTVECRRVNDEGKKGWITLYDYILQKNQNDIRINKMIEKNEMKKQNHNDLEEQVSTLKDEKELIIEKKSLIDFNISSDDPIVSLFIFNERLFVATTKRVFMKVDDGKFKELKFQENDYDESDKPNEKFACSLDIKIWRELNKCCSNEQKE